jgi:hypothetical protein
MVRDMLMNVEGTNSVMLAKLTTHDETELRMGVVSSQRLN